MSDFVTAIAKLDLASGTDRPDLDGLRETYPQLGFVFDLLEDKLTEGERIEIERRDELADLRQEYDRYVESLEPRVQELRTVLEYIKERSTDRVAVACADGVL